MQWNYSVAMESQRIKITLKSSRDWAALIYNGSSFHNLGANKALSPLDLSLENATSSQCYWEDLRALIGACLCKS